MKRFFLLSLLATMQLVLFAQDGRFAAKPVKVGEKVPDLTMTLHTLSGTETIHLKDLKGKMILMNYWGTGCAPCVAHMPELWRLQQKFGDKLVILMYTGDDEKQYKHLWSAYKKTLSPKIYDAAAHLPTVLNDSLLRFMFPSAVWGLNVWIDSNMIYQASKYNLPTEESIASFWKQSTIKSDRLVLPDLRDPKLWFSKRVGSDEHLLDYSFFGKYDEKFLGNGAFYDDQFRVDSSTGKVINFTMVNVSIPDLYSMAYFKKRVQDSHLDFEVKDPDLLFVPRQRDMAYVNEWRDNHRFCFSIKISRGQTDDIFQVMKTELDQHFNMESEISIRPRKCLILKRIGDKQGLISHDTKIEGIINILVDSLDNRTLDLQNLPIEFLRQQLVEDYTTYIGPDAIEMIDETGYTSNIDIKIPWGREHYSIPVLRKYLQESGLDLVEETRQLQTLVIRDRKFNSSLGMK